MRYAGIIRNDITDGIDGICVSFWVQGCPLHCRGCQNPQTWDFNGGRTLPDDWREQIYDAITAHGLKRNFAMLGGEPLCEENMELTHSAVCYVRNTFPNIKIFLWSGYTMEYLEQRCAEDHRYKDVLDRIDYLIDGPYKEEKRNVTLLLRGSANQRIWQKINGQWGIKTD